MKAYFPPRRSEDLGVVFDLQGDDARERGWRITDNVAKIAVMGEEDSAQFQGFVDDGRIRGIYGYEFGYMGNLMASFPQGFGH